MLLSLLAVIFSGFLLVVAFPKYDYSFLLFVALIPLLGALRGKSQDKGGWLWTWYTHVPTGVSATGGLMSVSKDIHSARPNVPIICR